MAVLFEAIFDNTAIPTLALFDQLGKSCRHICQTDGFGDKQNAVSLLADANRQIGIVARAGLVATEGVQRNQAFTEATERPGNERQNIERGTKTAADADGKKICELLQRCKAMAMGIASA